MRRKLISLSILLFLSPTLAQPSAAAARQPYEGRWATTTKACRDPDGVERMEIGGGGKRFYWYETRCTATEVKENGPNGWRLTLSCEGEGEKYLRRSRLSLPLPNRLMLDNAPVGPTKRQTYVRCARP